jgi:hypothetical protein
MITLFLAFAPCTMGALWLERIASSDSPLIFMLGFFASLFIEFSAFMGALWLVKTVKGH